MTNRHKAWSSISFLVFAAFAGCSNDEGKPIGPHVTVASFLSSCVPYCKKELSCHPQLTQFVQDCQTYCDGQAATLFPDAGTATVSCDIADVQAKLKQCAKEDACGDFDTCAKTLARSCSSLDVPASNGTGVTDSGVAGQGGQPNDAGMDAGPVGGSSGAAGSPHNVVDAGGAPDTGAGGAGGTFQVDCSLQSIQVGQVTCYRNMTAQPVTCKFSPTCAPVIGVRGQFCPDTQCGQGQGGAPGPGGGAGTGNQPGTGGTGAAVATSCTKLDACCQTLTDPTATQQCQTAAASNNDAQCRAAISGGGFCACSSLSTCCATLTQPAEQQQCNQTVQQNVINQCTADFGTMCGCAYLTTCCQALTDAQRQPCLTVAQQGNAAQCAQNAPLYCAQR